MTGRRPINEESRGAEPHCQESEGVPQIQSPPPFLARKGVRGMVGGVFNTLIGCWHLLPFIAGGPDAVEGGEG
jgi:hypothetical protein